MMTISAKIVADSISPDGKRITTFELEYPRFIHGEFMTHRLFSRNAASSRAIPVKKMIEAVRQSPASPIHWGMNQAGMQAKQQLEGAPKEIVKASWKCAADDACHLAETMDEFKAHKQIVNRILEPFQWMKTVVTATEFDNFFWLRNHPDAQPEIKRLAEVMLEEMNKSVPVQLRVGDWHTPYYAEGYWLKVHLDTNGWFDSQGVSLEDALAISSSCCAQVSYRKLDDSLEKAKDIFAKLIESKPCHASPTEHQATPMGVYQWTSEVAENLNILWDAGTTHCDQYSQLWSGNFKAWIQHRQLIEGNACWDYKEGETQ